jgi:hypothetical protein
MAIKIQQKKKHLLKTIQIRIEIKMIIHTFIT